MEALCNGRKDGATLPGVVANGDDAIESLPGEVVHGFRPVARDIDPNFTHGGNGFRTHVAGLGAGARNRKRRATIVPKQAFRHLAARGVSRAENQNSHKPHMPGFGIRG